MGGKMKYAICNEMYGDLGFEEVAEEAASLGYDGLEIAPFTLKPDPRELTLDEAGNFAKIAKGYGLEITGLHWLLSKPEGLHISTPDKNIRSKTIDFLKHLVRLNAAMEGDVLVFGSPPSRNIPEEGVFQEYWERARDTFAEMAKEAEKEGGVIALEPLSYLETNFLKTAEETIKMIKEIDSPNCRLHLDVKAMSYEDKSIADIIIDSKDYLEHFHANDPNLRGPGTGEIDYGPIFKALDKIDYSKWLSIEVFDYNEGARTIAENGIQFLKKFR